MFTRTPTKLCIKISYKHVIFCIFATFGLNFVCILGYFGILVVNSWIVFRVNSKFSINFGIKSLIILSRTTSLMLSPLLFLQIPLSQYCCNIITPENKKITPEKNIITKNVIYRIFRT